MSPVFSTVSGSGAFRDALYCDAFRQILRAAGVKPVRIPASSPNCNSIAERFVLSIKSECLNRFVFFGIESLRRATAEFVAHYLSERNHQGIGNRLIDPTENVGSVIGRVRKKERLGGLLNFYHRAA
jgi:putative transposase